MARKKSIKDNATSVAPETKEIFDTTIADESGAESAAAEAVETEEVLPVAETSEEEVLTASEPDVDETPEEETSVISEPELEAAPEVTDVVTPKTGAAFTIKDGAVEFVARRLRSRLSRADLPDAKQIGVILDSIAAGETAVVYRSSVCVGVNAPGRPTFDLVNDLQRHGYLSAV
jgi:hypothetical protein